MKTLYDVQQLLKKFGIYVHLGKRLWDIELMALELDRLYQEKVIDQANFITCKLVLTREHNYEEKQAGNY
ncbi:YqgQ family protein [Bombilactobacillus thymidiniphilus]|uniref:YqgQ family protein n=1 Tax=Bombilactobacillus thymidiniphilus TaxID=2923363 RepID=A0ABY4PF84_9LACO|nr:YqgQ family protein [Bombilactobacillus thymidiniphilus]UQS84374.1 YqgQ family protein [Bombilactobacillus thymidiniphilus]